MILVEKQTWYIYLIHALQDNEKKVNKFLEEMTQSDGIYSYAQWFIRKPCQCCNLTLSDAGV